ncbi:hypothetical protein BDN70DRAFT_939832 [Pholiota conissans]|uniref:Uncharacterized protein n=1 Tax=Pholiota conissans TaxID=109636 RepID=A0A9P6CKS1_9AGAR|nr:hypothetical protein BDN70DRAFT_939832 [Pholiota conissans]
MEDEEPGMTRRCHPLYSGVQLFSYPHSLLTLFPHPAAVPSYVPPLPHAHSFPRCVDAQRLHGRPMTRRSFSNIGAVRNADIANADHREDGASETHHRPFSFVPIAYPLLSPCPPITSTAHRCWPSPPTRDVVRYMPSDIHVIGTAPQRTSQWTTIVNIGRLGEGTGVSSGGVDERAGGVSADDRWVWVTGGWGAGAGAEWMGWGTSALQGCGTRWVSERRWTREKKRGWMGADVQTRMSK